MDIIVSHIFRMDLTKQCLDSIHDCHNVYLIDNSIVAECSSYAERRKFIHYIRPEKPPLSYAASLNRGIKASEAPWIVLSNNDILFSPRALERLDLLTKEKGIDLILTEAKWSCVVLSRKAYKKVGDFDERYVPCAGEDDDFWIRFCQEGFKWAAIPVGVWHMEDGHHSRVDGGRNLETFKKKWGFKWGGEKYAEIINSGLYRKPKIWTPSNE